MAVGRWLLHGLVVVGLALDAMLGGSTGVAPARNPAHAASVTPAVTLTAVDPRAAAVRYRVVTGPPGPIVEYSTDSGGHWAVALMSGVARQSPAAVAAGAGCRPASYLAVRALTPVAVGSAMAPSLYIATAGTIGDYLDGGCSSAVGGLFARQPSGAVTPLGTAGLPYDQDPAGRTIRAYDVDMVTPDPRQSAVLYVHASQGTGPGSPPEGLYRSVDAGRHWVEIDTGIRPSAVITNTVGVHVPVYGPGTLAIAPGAVQQLTWTTDTGTYSSRDGGTHWQLSGSAIAPAATPSVSIRSARPANRLRVPATQPTSAPTRNGAPARVTRSAASGPLMLGLDEGWAVNNRASLISPGQIGNTQLAGARYVRINFRLGGASSWSDQATLNAYDTVVNNFINAGIQVLGLVNQ
jgi:hypothetical protein